MRVIARIPVGRPSIITHEPVLFLSSFGAPEFDAPMVRFVPPAKFIDARRIIQNKAMTSDNSSKCLHGKESTWLFRFDHLFA